MKIIKSMGAHSIRTKGTLARSMLGLRSGFLLYSHDYLKTTMNTLGVNFEVELMGGIDDHYAKLVIDNSTMSLLDYWLDEVLADAYTYSKVRSNVMIILKMVNYEFHAEIHY